MNHRVHVAKEAQDRILEHARWVRTESGTLRAAERWMTAVYEAVEGLSDLPTAHALAEEDRHRPYEIRKMVIRGITLLFHVDGASDVVYVLSARGSTQRPDPGTLPDRPGSKNP